MRKMQSSPPQGGKLSGKSLALIGMPRRPGGAWHRESGRLFLGNRHHTIFRLEVKQAVKTFANVLLHDINIGIGATE